MPFFHRDSLSSSSSRDSIEDPNQHRNRFSTHRSSRSQSAASHGSASSGNSGTPKRFSSMLHRHPGDLSVRNARDRVDRAEAAEKAAGKALAASHKAVHDARDHVKKLEKEATQEARLAKAKQSEAKSISKRAKPLGRYI